MEPNLVEELCTLCKTDPETFKSLHADIIKGKSIGDEYIDELIMRCFPGYVGLEVIEDLLNLGLHISSDVVLKTSITSTEFLSMVLLHNVQFDKNKLLWSLFDVEQEFDGALFYHFRNYRLRGDCFEKVQELIDAGANVNTSINGVTVLMKALTYPDAFSKSISLLLRSGASLKVIDNNNKTPLNYLVNSHSEKTPEIFNLLLKEGLNISFENEHPSRIPEDLPQIRSMLNEHGIF